jgi:hypothetical protein
VSEEPAQAISTGSARRDAWRAAALLLAFGLLDVAKGLYFLRHYPQAAPFDAYYNVGLRLMRDIVASRSAADLVAAFGAMKGLAYLVGAGALYGPWAMLKPGDFQWMREGLALVDALNLVLAAALLFLWTRRLFAAFAVALLWLIFPGFTLNLVRGYPEPFIVLCFLLSLLAFTGGQRRPSLPLYALSGFLFLFSIFVRVQVMPFFLMVSCLVLLVAARWILAPARRRRALAFLAGWLPILGVWVLLLVKVQDPVRLESFSFHAFQRVYPHGFWLYLDTDGWMGPYNLRQYPFYLSLVEAARHDPDLLASSFRQWVFAAGYVLRHVDESARTVLVNVYRFFAKPTNDYKWDYPYPYGLQRVVQGLVSVIGLAGLLRSRRPGVPWAPVGLYTFALTLLYAISHVELRYHLPVMAPVLLGAGLWCDEVRQWPPSSASRRALLAVLTAAALTALLWAWCWRMTQPRWAPIVHGLAVIGSAATLFAFFRGMTREEARAQRRAGTALGALGASALLAVGMTDVGWHDRRLALTPGTNLRQRIVLGADGRRLLEEAEEAYVVFDLARAESARGCLSVEVEGARHGGDELFPAMPHFPLGTTAGGRDPAWFRQWWALPLGRAERERLGPEVEIGLLVSPACRNTNMTLGADNLLRDAGRDYEGPSFEEWRKVSVYRLLYDGEHRLPVRRRRLALERRSGRVEGGRYEPLAADLRIGLVVPRPGGGRLEWETAPAGKRQETSVVFRAESGRTGEGLLHVQGGGTAGPVSFPLASREPFAREAGAIQLWYAPERLGEDRTEGLYLVRVPAALVRAGQPVRLLVTMPTRLSTEERYFAVRPTPAVDAARHALGSLPVGDGHLLEGFGRFLDASHNTYPADTGPWELAGVF